ncbi:MAG: SRPBCC family protein [Saprospiraceae bacterium]
MKYTCTVEIDAPIKKVVELWEAEENFKEWQDGFQSIEHLSGTPNTEGAKSKIVLDGKMRIELIETILSMNLPTEKLALYEHIHMTNTQASRFESLTNGKTRYVSEVEYLKFNGLMIKLMAKLFPGKFKAQSQKWMNQFKAFAEQAVSADAI